MKMDTGVHTPESGQTEVYFSPISQQLGAPIPPDQPFDPALGPWSASREVVPFYFEHNLPAPSTVDSERRRKHARVMVDQDVDIRFCSPREMASLSLELYVRGLVAWDEYVRLAFQPELHPDYDATIGALLEEQADPDKPQDFVRVWEDRLAYERKYNARDNKRVRASERITLLMRRLAGITSMRA